MCVLYMCSGLSHMRTKVEKKCPKCPNAVLVRIVEAVEVS
jgi:hypothetical protein